MVFGMVGFIVATILHTIKQNEVVRAVQPTVPKSPKLEILSASRLQSVKQQS